MEKYIINIDKSSYDKESIENKVMETLLPIFQWYDPFVHSDLYYIKIFINKSLSMTIKWVMPFDKNTTKSYVIYAYINYVSKTTIECQDMIFSSSIHDINQLKLSCEAISKCTVEYINIDIPNSIIITTNLNCNSIREQRGFKLLNLEGISDDEKFSNYIYYIGQHLNDHINYALMRLCINIDMEYETISGVYEIIVHCSTAFNNTTYDVSFNYPQDPREPVFGVSFEELVKGLTGTFELFQHIKDSISKYNDECEIKYYIIKQEVTY